MASMLRAGQQALFSQCGIQMSFCHRVNGPRRTEVVVARNHQQMNKRHESALVITLRRRHTSCSRQCGINNRIMAQHTLSPEHRQLKNNGFTSLSQNGKRDANGHVVVGKNVAGRLASTNVWCRLLRSQCWRCGRWTKAWHVARHARVIR